VKLVFESVVCVFCFAPHVGHDIRCVLVFQAFVLIFNSQEFFVLQVIVIVVCVE